jgi:hypothetical protein
MIKVALVILFSMVGSIYAHACDEAIAKPIAAKVTQEIDIMIKFTKAACLPTSDGGKCSIVCVSDLYVTGMNRDIVLLFITASAGKKMRDAGLKKFSNVVFADRALLLSKHALKISAERASVLQQSGLGADGEKPEVAAARVGREYSEVGFRK